MSDEFEIDDISPEGDSGPLRDDLPTGRASYAWAMDCDWVWQNLGGKMTRTQAGSASRWALWQFAKKDMDKFIQQIMPKAMMLLEKALDKEGDTEVIVIKERKNIRELKQILADALVEAGR